LAAFVLVNTHDLADPVDAALGILRLAIPNAPAQTFDLVDDYGLCLHPAGIVGRQPACCLRRMLDPYCDVELHPSPQGGQTDDAVIRAQALSVQIGPQAHHFTRRYSPTTGT
jgi:hypothetical protein